MPSSSSEERTHPWRGHHILEEPLLNKGTAFSLSERQTLGLHGLLPPHVETLDEQLARSYEAYQGVTTDLARHIFLRELQDTNETLFYALLTRHVTEMMPIVYTPSVGDACQHFSDIYQRPRGLFLSYPLRDSMEEMLRNASPDHVEVIVVTDGERILGLGDQGVDGMGIPIGKLSLYSACGGVNPAGALPIALDVGTNNVARRNHPGYLGWRHDRVTGDEYYAFLDQFVEGVKNVFPNALLQFEDFARDHAEPLLSKYRDQLCCFNDDIQGTATVALGAIWAGVKASGGELTEQKVVLLGAGSAGCGIAEQLVRAMCAEGLSESQARSRFYLVDRYGLLLEGQSDLTSAQKKFVRCKADVSSWGVEGEIGLEQVLAHAGATILIGVSGQPNTFTETAITAMARHTERPIIFPLSNPTSKAEGIPADILRWTRGKALVATGSPFAPVTLDGQTHTISQCNNCYIFPGMGQGILAVGARRVSDEMFIQASRALMSCSPALASEGAPLLPPLSEIRATSRKVAIAVALQAQKEGLADIEGDPETLVAQRWWEPTYQS